MFALTLKTLSLAALFLCVFGLALPSVARAKYQIVARIASPDGELVIDARPYNPNEAGTSAVILRYRYRGVELTRFRYGTSETDRILFPYLQRDAARIRDLGLNPKRGHWFNSSYPQRGHTLYLPPSKFSAEEVDRLADAIRANQGALRDAFMHTKIRGRFLLLMETQGTIYLDGIARLVHAELPFVDTYSSDWLTVVIEREGRVLLHSTYRGKNHPPEIVDWGQMLPPRRRGGKPQLRLRAVTLQEGSPKVYDSENAKKWTKVINRHGRTLRETYEILPQ